MKSALHARKYFPLEDCGEKETQDIKRTTRLFAITSGHCASKAWQLSWNDLTEIPWNFHEITWCTSAVEKETPSVFFPQALLHQESLMACTTKAPRATSAASCSFSTWLLSSMTGLIQWLVSSGAARGWRSLPLKSNWTPQVPPRKLNWPRVVVWCEYAAIFRSFRFSLCSTRFVFYNADWNY